MSLRSSARASRCPGERWRSDAQHRARGRKPAQKRATDIVDAETELTQAHLQRLDAHVDLLVAQTRLELAVGDRLF